MPFPAAEEGADREYAGIAMDFAVQRDALDLEEVRLKDWQLRWDDRQQRIDSSLVALRRRLLLRVVQRSE
jgi:hypothetical protein